MTTQGLKRCRGYGLLSLRQRDLCPCRFWPGPPEQAPVEATTHFHCSADQWKSQNSPTPPPSGSILSQSTRSSGGRLHSPAVRLLARCVVVCRATELVLLHNSRIKDNPGSPSPGFLAPTREVRGGCRLDGCHFHSPRLVHELDIPCWVFCLFFAL